MAPRAGESLPYPRGEDDTPPYPYFIEGALAEGDPQDREHDPQFSAMYGHDTSNPAYAGLEDIVGEVTQELPVQPAIASEAAQPHEPTSQRAISAPGLEVDNRLVPPHFKQVLETALSGKVDSPPPTEIKGIPDINRRLMDAIGATAANDIPVARQALDNEIEATRATVDQVLTPAPGDTDLPLLHEAQRAHTRPWEEEQDQ